MVFQRSTYYDAQRHSPALIRARRPYLFKNTIYGIALSAFAIGVFSYTMRAIGQDEFEDVKAPDLPVKQTSEGVKK